jgi:ubiquinone/menaquinone biosynthesis C-methylase UbiE
MQPEKSMKDYYASRAREFDRVYAKPERQNDLRHLENWLPTVFSNRRVLEVACGTGYWTQFIATKAVHVVATDATLETLDIAQKRITAWNVDFHIADAYALPDQLGPFNAAFGGFWFSHVPRSRIRRFLDNLHARLEPGALVLFLDNLYVEIAWRLARDYWGFGFATEAARAARNYGFSQLNLAQIVSFTVPANQRSRNVMTRIGMTHSPDDNFEHPLLPDGHPLRHHVLYRLTRPVG